MIATLSIVIVDPDGVNAVNELLHVFRGAVLGRMGLPLADRGVSVINLVLDASSDEVNALAGRLGSVKGVYAKALTPRIPDALPQIR